MLTFILCILVYYMRTVSRRVGDGAHAGDATDRDRRALREAGRIALLGNRIERLDVGRGPDQVAQDDGRDTVLEVVLVSAGRKLAGVVQNRFVLRVGDRKSVV